jgi:flavin reductase (DIM6/NTAB) family NADH-FMN oxidoreductase RutF
MFYDAVENRHGLPNDPFKAIVAPRPIGWVSTLSESGIANLAPYSFFNAVSESPHYVVFGSGGMKDSLTNVKATGAFAINIATYALREQMNLSSARVGPDVDEFALSGLTRASAGLSGRLASRRARRPSNAGFIRSCRFPTATNR